MDTNSDLLGASKAICAARELITRFAQSPASTVLITGESGTGKDLAARLLHLRSERRGGHFVNITCSALPEPLLESELFGHERGAFTDAKQRRIGLLEQAAAGTVFLDEIAEMAPSLQAKLLRFLEEKAFRRVGGAEDIKPDVRVIAATHRDLQQAVREERFRADLYYRLAVLHITLPALREREGDIELLAAHFIAHFNRAFGKRVSRLSRDALRALERHPWPGNVRELRNVIERAVLLSRDDEIRAQDLPLHHAICVGEPVIRGYPDLPVGGVDIEELVHHFVVQALLRSHGNKTRAAELLGMTRDQIRYHLDKYAARAPGKSPH